MAPRPAERIGDVIGASFTPLVVLAADPYGWYRFTPVKWLLVTTVGALVIASGVLVRGRCAGRVDRRILVLGAAFIGWTVVCAATGLEGRYAWWGTPERHAGVVLWVLCAAVFVAGPRLRALEHGAVIAAVGLAASVTQRSGGRSTGTFGSAAYLGAACVLLLPVVAAVATDRTRSTAWRAAAAFGSMTLLVLLIGSGTRGAWVAAIAVAAIAVIGGLRPRLRVVGAALGIAIVAAVLLVPSGRVTSTFDAEQAGGAGRLDEWRVGVTTLGDHLLTGAGPEAYRLAFREGVDVSYEREHGRDVQPDRAHNVLLDMALTTGVPGVALYIALIVAVALRTRHVGVRDSVGATGAALALTGYLLQQMFLFPLAELEPIAWMMAGALVARRPPVTAADRPPVARSSIRRIAAPGGAAACVAIAGVALVAGLRDVAADRAAQRAIEAARRGDATTVRRHLADALDERSDEVRLHLLTVSITPDASVAASSLASAVDLSPLDPIVLRRVADAALRDGPPAEALRIISGLVDDDPHNAYLQQRLGTAAVLAGDEALAEASWTIAADLAPHNPEPGAYLATLYEQQGRHAEAVVAATRALATAPSDAQIVTQMQAIVGSGS